MAAAGSRREAARRSTSEGPAARKVAMQREQSTISFRDTISRTLTGGGYGIGPKDEYSRMSSAYAYQKRFVKKHGSKSFPSSDVRPNRLGHVARCRG